jgi:hypothetical protein
MVVAAITVGLLMMVGLQPASGQQTGTNQLNIFQNYFVTGDYVVAGWVKGTPDGSGFTPGIISVPDTLQPTQTQNGVPVPASVPKGADIVAAYLYWATVEGNQTLSAGKSAFFNGYAISGTALGNPNAPTSWSAGGCSGSTQGSKTMHTYRADVHPYLPLDTDPASSTYGATVANGKINVSLADSGSNGNTVPIALGATLVIIYRVLSPAVPLNAIILYDGVYAPSNAGQNASQKISGFYQPALSPQAKITHIVANGQANKGEQVYLNNASQPLPSLYGSLPPFPGIYGTWDNPTWVLSNYGYVKTTDTSETTSVIPSGTNSGCVSWGAMILSTTVQDTDGDGLLDVWENNQGYTDAVSNQLVALPGANPNHKDIFVELDYLTDLDGSPNQHSHLPKRDALDAVGALFANQGVAIHFDLGVDSFGKAIYGGDPYVVPGGIGGNAISEGLLLCTDGAALCAFPGQPAVGWKGGLSFVQNSPKLGNFQPGRDKSYHYIFFGHSLGEPRSYWSTVGATLALNNPNVAIPQLRSIMVTGNKATITLRSPSFFPPADTPPTTLKPGDCTINPALHGCADASNLRISITGALGQTSLNGSYIFSNATTILPPVNNVVTTTFTITTSGVADGTYSYANEPQLAVTYLGPTSSSGHSDFRGGADTVVTLGLWGADDPANCQPDPSQSLTADQPVYCSNQTGTIGEQTGTVLHELGHTLALTHGGTSYPADRNDPNASVPTNGLNCAPNYLSVMNYLFQVRGFVDGGFEYSTQTLPPLNESVLNESTGIGADLNSGQPATHLTRWYAPPNLLDAQLAKTSGGRYPSHCDGTPALPTDPQVVRVDGTVAPGGTFSAPLDWNNDYITPDAITPKQSPLEDLNHNGVIDVIPFLGSNDWQSIKINNQPTINQSINLQQIGARKGALGFSGGGVENSGAGVENSGAGVDNSGAGVENSGAGVENSGAGVENSGAGLENSGAGVDQTEDTATSTADRPTALKCTVSLNGLPGCVASSGGFLENGKSVPLTWTAPGFGQTRSYIIWRAVGSFTPAQIISNSSAFSVLKTLTGQPPSPSYIDTAVKNGVTYTYFLTDKNKQGAQSAPTDPLVVTVKF